MKVNGIDINRFSARQLRYEIEHREVTSKSEWPAALETPVMKKKSERFQKYNSFCCCVWQRKRRSHSKQK